MNRQPWFRVLIGAGALILIHQVVDLWAVLAGTDFSTPAGRLRLVLTVSSRLAALLAANVLVVFGAVARRGRWLGRLGWVYAAIGVLLLVLIPFFLNDAGRISSTIPGEGLAAFRLTIARTLLVLLVTGLLLLMLRRPLQSVAREAVV